MPEPAASVRGVSFEYGSFKALQNVDFEVQAGTFFGLLGPNGSGKTTLFRILSTLMPPATGTCSIHGHDTTRQADAVRRCIGMIFQQPSLDEALTIRENLSFHGQMYGIRGNALKSRIELLAEKNGIGDRLDDRVSKLSGGLKRRADIVRGILHQPRLLLLDEPTTALDPAARHNFWHLLGSLRIEENLTLILATHLLEEAESCDNVVILDKGVIVVQGNPEELRSNLGRQMLWLSTDTPQQLAEHMLQRFNIESQILENAVCISDEKSASRLSAIYEDLGPYIKSATIRKPTLEDVFLTATGNPFTNVLSEPRSIEA